MWAIVRVENFQDLINIDNVNRTEYNVLVNIDVNFGQTNQLFAPFKQRDKISKINNYNLEMLFIFRLISTEVSQ